MGLLRTTTLGVPPFHSHVTRAILAWPLQHGTNHHGKHATGQFSVAPPFMGGSNQPQQCNRLHLWIQGWPHAGWPVSPVGVIHSTQLSVVLPLLPTYFTYHIPTREAILPGHIHPFFPPRAPIGKKGRMHLLCTMPRQVGHASHAYPCHCMVVWRCAELSCSKFPMVICPALRWQH